MPLRRTSRTISRSLSTSVCGSTAVGSSSTSTPRPPSQPSSAAAMATIVRSTGVAYISGTVDVDVHAEPADERASGLLLR